MAHGTMATTKGNLPPLPAQHAQFIEHIAVHPQTPVPDLLEPYVLYETALRKTFAEQLEHACDAAEENNIVPIFAGQERQLKIHARDLSAETQLQRDTYILPLSPKSRKANGVPAVVSSLEEFKMNLSIFSVRSLEDVDWSNVVAAGGAAARHVFFWCPLRTPNRRRRFTITTANSRLQRLTSTCISTASRMMMPLPRSDRSSSLCAECASSKRPPSELETL
jgi:hypothetical protein